MKERLKAVLKKTPLYFPLKKWAAKRKIRQWERDGKPFPPPHVVKQRTLSNLAKKFKLNILIETGTLYGDMIEAMKRDFEKVYSIELSRELFEKAKEKFKNQPKVELIQGDSGVELGKLMHRLDQPALFWLDGHYSGGTTARGRKDTPIYEELEHIFDQQGTGHVIVIDDARCFGPDPNYPSIEELREFVKARRPDACLTVDEDSIRITPGQAA